MGWAVVDRRPAWGAWGPLSVSVLDEGGCRAHADVCDLTGVGHLASFGLPWRRRAGCQASHGVTRGGSAIAAYGI